MRKIASLILLAIIFSAIAGAEEADRSIKHMFDQNDIKYTIDSDGDFLLGFTEGNTVIVNSNKERYNEVTVREIWTSLGPIGDRDQLFLYRMLKENFRIKLGAYAIKENGGEVYALYVIKISSEASWREVWNTILFCANIKLPE